MSRRDVEELLRQLVAKLREEFRYRPEEILSEEFAKSIAKFINALWCELKLPDDLKSRLIELVLEYVLSASLRVRRRAKRDSEEESTYIPSRYVI